MKKILFLLIFITATTSGYTQQHTSVRILSKTNFTPATDSVLALALPLIDSVVNSAAFAEGIRNARFKENRNLSNEQILTLFLSGREVHTAAANDTIDLHLETYPDQNGNNIGTTHLSKSIVSSQAYILRNGARCYAAHIIHEYCHTIGNNMEGFTHPHSTFWPGQRKKKCLSVPYITGDLARMILGVATCNCECENYPQN